MAENKEETSEIILNDESADLEREKVETTTSDGKTTITIYENFCKGCDICAEVCPKDVLRMVVALDRWEGSMVEIVNMDACNACMLCEYQCPDFAIEVRNIKKERKKKKRKEGKIGV